MPTVRLVPSNYGRSNTNYVTVTDSENMYNNTDHTANYCTLRGRAGRSSNSTYYAFINGFNFSAVPSNAKVSSFKVKIRAYRGSYEATGSSYRIRLASQASNSYVISNTTLGSDITTTSGGTVYEIPTGSLTWSQIVGYGSNFSIDIPLRNSSSSSSNYPYVYVYGAEIEVTYTIDIPRTITASSDSPNATVFPTSQVINEGESGTVAIRGAGTVSATDNNADVTSQLVQKTDPGYNYVVQTAPNAEYGFALNGSGYYESTNKGVDKSAAVCVVYFHLEAAATVTFSYINYAEATYDFGIFGNIDETLNNNYKPASGSMPDSSYRKACNTSADNSSSVQTLAYSLTAGDHYIYVKYTKDDATSSNNDTLQFKVAVALTGSFTPSDYYEYTIANIASDHSVVVSAVVVSIPFRIKQNGTWQTVTKVLVKQNGAWAEATKLLVKQNGTWNS